MVAAENVLQSYKSRAKSENWAEWVRDNKMEADILAEAEKLANEEEDE